MGYLIGTDEAGYGPNLGPLVVSATVWEAPDDVRGDDLFELLRETIVATPRQAKGGDGPRVAMADSKALYKPGGGLKHLERGLFAALAVLYPLAIVDLERTALWMQVLYIALLLYACVLVVCFRVVPAIKGKNVEVKTMPEGAHE